MILKLIITGLLITALVLLIHGIETYQRVRQIDFVYRAGSGYIIAAKNILLISVTIIIIELIFSFQA